MGWRRERLGYQRSAPSPTNLTNARNVFASGMATVATGQITGPNTSVQVTPQDQTRVCRSDHRTKHECSTSQITGPNTSVVQVGSQDQTESSTGRITGPNTSVAQVGSQDQTRV